MRRSHSAFLRQHHQGGNDRQIAESEVHTDRPPGQKAELSTRQTARPGRNAERFDQGRSPTRAETHSVSTRGRLSVRTEVRSTSIRGNMS